MKQAVRDCNPALARFEASCFDGEYITGDVTPAYLDRVERAREQPSVAASDDSARSQLSLAIEAAES
jgi:amidophosphoribosyltransferase